MLKISPSLLACDFSRMGKELCAISDAGADMAHLDIMDGHFVPNLTFGPAIVKTLREKSGVLFDVHLMLTDPLRYLAPFADAGADIITFHVESASNTAKTISAIRALGKMAGLSLKPGTPADAVKPFLGELDMLLIMTVEPGYGGQSFMPDMLPKISLVREWAEKINPGLDLQVDGGIDDKTAPLVTAAGANVLVAGSYVFNSADYKRAIDSLRG